MRAVMLVCALSCWPLLAGAQQMRPAEKMAVGQTVHFTLEKDEQKDFAIQLGAGTYRIVWDVKRADDEFSNIQATARLLKSNGSVVDNRLLNVNAIHTVARVGRPFRVPKPFAARVRVENGSMPNEFWMTVVRATPMRLIPFAFETEPMQPLGIGSTQGKGGTLEARKWAFHTVKLPAGKYDVSLYLKRPDGRRSNVQGWLIERDAYGFAVEPEWRLMVNEIGEEARRDKRLILLKPATVIFQVTNMNSSDPIEYTVGIEKATD